MEAIEVGKHSQLHFECSFAYQVRNVLDGTNHLVKTLMNNVFSFPLKPKDNNIFAVIPSDSLYMESS